MRVFGDMGQRLEYEICCSEYAKRDHEGWLYDMTWRVMKNGVMTHLPTVLESELNRGPRQGDAVDLDFQKLVQSQADIRVWISASPASAEQHIENCKQQIDLFFGMTPGDRYAFAVYDWKIAMPLIEKFAACNHHN